MWNNLLEFDSGKKTAGGGLLLIYLFIYLFFGVRGFVNKHVFWHSRARLAAVSEIPSVPGGQIYQFVLSVSQSVRTDGQTDTCARLRLQVKTVWNVIIL